MLHALTPSRVSAVLSIALGIVINYKSGNIILGTWVTLVLAYASWIILP